MILKSLLTLLPGQWRFLDLSLGNHSLYPEVLERLQTGSQSFLDLGCAFGQDIRRLVFDGAKSEHCYGSDLLQDFLDLGYDLFRDKATLKAKFIQADIFDPSSQLSQLDGKLDILHTASFFHLFSRDDQKIIAKRVLKLMKPAKNTLILGRQVGSREPGEVAKLTGEGKQANATHFRHDEKTWQQLWDEVGTEVGDVKFDVKVDMRDRVFPNGFKTPMMEFSVRRL